MKAIALDDLDWSADAHEALMKVAALGRPFDAYDLTEKVGLRDPSHPNQWGSIFRQANDAGLIKAVGYHRSRRPGRSGGACRVWQVAA